jgi:hypothetical protein
MRKILLKGKLYYIIIIIIIIIASYLLYTNIVSENFQGLSKSGLVRLNCPTGFMTAEIDQYGILCAKSCPSGYTTNRNSAFCTKEIPNSHIDSSSNTETKCKNKHKNDGYFWDTISRKCVKCQTVNSSFIEDGRAGYNGKQAIQRIDNKNYCAFERKLHFNTDQERINFYD